MLFLLFSHLADLFELDLALLPYVVSQCRDSLVLDLSSGIVSFAVEIIREEHVNFIDKQNLRSLVLAQVNFRFVSLELFLEDMGQ